MVPLCKKEVTIVQLPVCLSSKCLQILYLKELKFRTKESASELEIVFLNVMMYWKHSDIW